MTFLDELNRLNAEGNMRQLHHLKSNGKYILHNGALLLNLSGNDYMGIAADVELRQEFLSQCSPETTLFGSSASRLLTGNHPIFEELEERIAQLYGRERALLFNSGYHANLGILPAISNNNSLLLADKLVHASLIDGLKLSAGKYLRYRHNDLTHLTKLLEQHASQHERVIIITESIFSMDGDKADLPALTTLKRQFPNVMLYVDEAHAVGVRGERGLGICEETNCINDIDFIVGTFGKAFASMGAYVVCNDDAYHYLVNKMRPLIFSTALPPIITEWTLFTLNHLVLMHKQRLHLKTISETLHSALNITAGSNIIPVILHESHRAIEAAKLLEKEGYFALPIRPPTVPCGTSRLRLSLSATMTIEESIQLANILQEYSN